MITNFKIFESESQYREVDLQQLWDDIINKYYSKIFDKPVLTHLYFQNVVLKPLLLFKNIEFKRAEHSYDGDIIYGLSGKVEDVKFKYDSFNYLIKHIFVVLEDGQEYHLGNINNNFNFNDKRPLIVKIYDVEETEIEKKLNLLKDSDKYNL